MLYSMEELRRRILPVAQKYDIPAVYLFGSYARGDATDASDVDVLIQRTGSRIHGWMMGGVYEDLRREIGKNVDLVTTETLEQASTRARTPWFVENVLRERRLIYVKQ